ncbi:MAG: hypothetical protein M1820_010278 [Bogoriella megaspora]|nr:MAG: hypothetical protein M1820_010278 [Bogoriella megaspora]
MPATSGRKALAETTANIKVPRAAAGTKRTSSDAKFDEVFSFGCASIGLDSTITPFSRSLPTEDDDNDVAENSDDELRGMYIDKDCNQVRRMINTFIEAGGMKVGEFQKTIQVSSNAYSRFMGQNGKDKGLGCDTYQAAWAFFKKRELKGIPMPKKRKTAPTESTTAAKKSTASSTKSTNTKGPSSADLSEIHLDGEETDSVPIYDTCDEIRRKISAHLRKEGVTAAALCRDIHSMFNTERRPSRIQSKQLNDFRNKKGALAGNTSSVYYGAYVFFEKMRILEGKPENKHRQECEEEWPMGITTERQSGYVGNTSRDIFGDRMANLIPRMVICPAGARPVIDKFGKISMH